MRRSAAPSQLGKLPKRPRFVPPFATSTSDRSSGFQTKFTANTSTNRISLITGKNFKSGCAINKTLSEKQNIVSQNKNSFLKSKTPINHESEEKEALNESTLDKKWGHAEKSKGVCVMKCEKENTFDGFNDHLMCNDGFDDMDVCMMAELIEAADHHKEDSPVTDICDKMAGELDARPKKVAVRRAFKSPTLHMNKTSQDKCILGNPKASPVVDSSEDDLSHYYNVMWCKRSRKKRKVWEGDAILIIKGRSVSLLDTEGKEIGKTSTYKASELKDLSEGQSLLIGGKEIEVMSTLPADDFHSGKCFLGGGNSSSACGSSVSEAARPFSTPVRSKTNALPSRLTSSVTPKPLHDPTRPDALILPRPSQSHQWHNNQHKLALVDVVVDPHLACDLRPHQREGVIFLYKCILGLNDGSGNGAILADEMGLGKTLQCISLIWTLFKQGPYGGKPLLRRILVVTPGSLVKNWCKEFKIWLGKERMNVFAVGTDSRIQEFINSPIYPVMVVSYDMLLRYADDIRKIKFDLMVCDEAHRLKNNTIKTTMLLSSLSIKRRILLTGTPIQNDLQEFYSLAEFANPSVLGSSSSFHRVYEEPILRSRQPDATEEEKVIGKTRAEELARITSLFVLRRTQEINNKYLPPKVESVVFCRPTELQRSLYCLLLSSRSIRKCLTRGAVLGGVNSPHLVCIGALKKLCNEPCLLFEGSKKAEEDESEVVDWKDEEESIFSGLYRVYPEGYDVNSVASLSSGKLHVLAGLLKVLHHLAVPERIVVVSNYTQTLDVLQRLCEAASYKCCRLDGSTPTSKRQEIVEYFNSKYSTYTVFLLSSKAGGVGLNLIGASRLVLYDIDWNPANDLQAMARVWRDGQRKQVHIYRLITAGTIEEKIYQRQISKQGLSGAVVDSFNQSEVKFSLEELKDLFTLKEDAVCMTHDKLDCNCTGDGQIKSESSHEEETGQERPFQLVKQSNKRSDQEKNVSMGELLKWKHFKGPLSKDFKDSLLVEGQERITYVFQNETNTARVQAANGQSSSNSS